MLRSYKHSIDKQLNIETLFGLVLCASLFSSIFFSSSTFAQTASLSTSGDIVLNLIPNPSGDTTGVGKDTLTISTTCTAGYNLDISSSSSSASLYLNGNTSNTASNDNVVVSPVSGTKALSTNEWGYSTTSSSISGNFTGLSPTSSTLATSSTSVTNQSLDVYYGVKLSNTAKPGSYTMPAESSVPGAIVYYLTMDPICAAVDIAYDGNNADAGTMGAVDTGIIHTNVREGDTVDLIASNFSRNGYGFAGWSTDENAGTKLVDNDNTNNPVVYGPQESITIPVGFLDYDTDNDGVVKLYAVWIPSQGNLQGWIGCSSLDTTTYDSTTGALDLTKNSVTALTDQRDNDTYAVARLADGNCWMIENLRLDADATRGNNQNDPTVTNEWLSQGYGTSTTYGNFGGLADAENTGFTLTYSAANSLYYSGTQEGTASINIGTSNNPGYRMPRYNNLNTTNRAANPTSNTFTDNNTTGGMYSYGNYYTWHAAIADLTYNGTNNQSTTGTSLCPTGWHLPTGGLAYASGNTSGVNVTGDTSTFREFYNLGYETMDKVKTAYEDTPNSGWAYYSANTTNTVGKTATAAFRSFPNNFLYSGYFNGSLAYYRGRFGYYWSSTASRSDNSYGLSLSSYSSNVYPGTNYDYKGRGLSIRCVSGTPETYNLTYNANGGSGAPASQSITTNGAATFTVSNTTPTRSGYTFTGWMDEKGNEVQPGGTFRTRDPNVVLYAIWTNNSCNPTATTIGTGNTSTDAVCLQDVKPSMKSSLPTADSTTDTYTLIDARDGQSYTVAKLADGNLWLTKNLNYGSSNDTLLTPYDTDLPAGINFKAPASTTAFETANNNTTYVSPKILTDSTYGGYYSFAAAIASTIAYSVSGQNITSSICPKGWDLPTGTMYNNLRTTSGNTTFAKMRAAPYNFIYAGYRDGTSFTSQTSALRLWTSTNYSSSYAYYTTAYGTASYSGNYKRYGESVRCVASNGTGTIHYNANGGTGTMADQTGDINSMSNIQSNSFTAPDHKQFREWCTNANGTGTCVAPGANVSAVGLVDGNTVNLYAQWDDVYVFTFVNTALTSNNTRTKKVVVGSSGTVAPSSSWSRTDYKLVGWDTVTNDASDSAGTVVYTNSQSITPTGDMTFYTVWRPIYAIAYDINTTDSNAAGTMGSQTNIVEGDSVTLLASNFSRAGYGFAGWSLDPNATTNTSAKIYGPQETITAPAYPGTNTLTFYAVWVQSAGSIQNTTTVSSVCNSLTTAPTDGTANISSVSALTDQRDNQTYAIAKLADGNCWMIENLRLESTAEHNTDGTLAQGYHSSFIGLSGSESANFSNSTTANDLYTTESNIQGKITISGSYTGFRFPRYNNTNTSVRAAYTTNQNVTHQDANIHSYGNYYTWHAAMANTTHYSGPTATDADGKTSETVNTSLCPTGWRLPYGRNTGNGAAVGGFYNLNYKINNDSNVTNSAASLKLRSFPNNFLYSGYFIDSRANSRGNYGYYWSSTANGYGASYFLDLSSSDVRPGTFNGGKDNGRSIRCVSGS